MKKPLNLAISFLITAATIAASYGSYTHQFNNPEPEKDTPMILEEVIELPEPTLVVVSEVPLIRTTEFVNLTFEEQDLLEQIAYAEASGEDSKGMALVMRVVLNRSLRDGQSIREVIFAPNQFYTAGMTTNVSDECHEALGMIMDGWDESDGACYFAAGGYSRYGEPLFQYGNHYFSK